MSPPYHDLLQDGLDARIGETTGILLLYNSTESPLDTRLYV